VTAPTDPGPASAEPIADPAAHPILWERVSETLIGTRFYWLATTPEGGPPHVRPVLGVYDAGSLWSTSSLGAVKARNLDRVPLSTITTRDDEVDVVVEAVARRVTDQPTLERIAAVYLEKYGWPPVVDGDQYDAPYGAPTAGPPPYALFEHRPTTVWAFGTSDELGPRSARFRF
jgi:hypothetical protein